MTCIYGNFKKYAESIKVENRRTDKNVVKNSSAIYNFYLKKFVRIIYIF